MSKRTDSNSYTLLFTIGMVLIVGTLLAFTASQLSGKIEENKRLEKQQNILYAMGVNEIPEGDKSTVAFVSTQDVATSFDKYITKQYVIAGAKASEVKDAYLINIKKEATKAKEAGYQRKLPLFIGEKEGKTFYIIPMHGKGLWDAVWGYVSLNDQMIIQGVYFDHKGETPGLGANINKRFFMDDFVGEHIFNNNLFKGVSIVKGNADPNNNDKTDNEVDALAGATITGNGLANMIKTDLKLYLPYLKTIKK